MEENSETKEQLIDEIKSLIDTNNDTIINPKYIDYFELDELLEIRDGLKYKKENSQKDRFDYLDDIFSKCSI